MKRNSSKNLPAFESVDELIAFFETHDMGDYWEKLSEVEVEVCTRNSKETNSESGSVGNSSV